MYLIKRILTLFAFPFLPACGGSTHSDGDGLVYFLSYPESVRQLKVDGVPILTNRPTDFFSQHRNINNLLFRDNSEVEIMIGPELDILGDILIELSEIPKRGEKKVLYQESVYLPLEKEKIVKFRFEKETKTREVWDVCEPLVADSEKLKEKMSKQISLFFNFLKNGDGIPDFVSTWGLARPDVIENRFNSFLSQIGGRKQLSMNLDISDLTVNLSSSLMSMVHLANREPIISIKSEENPDVEVNIYSIYFYQSGGKLFMIVEN